MCRVSRDGYEWLTGYCRVPESLNENGIVVHGGITYDAHRLPPADVDGPSRWIGFDTIHAGDRIRVLYTTHSFCIVEDPHGKLWTVDDVVKEVNWMADQVSGMED